MVVLICAAVGMRAPLFAVDVNETLVVGLLKDVIKEKMPDKIKCSAARLHLFLAEKGGHWLQDDAPAALELVEGKIHEDVQAMIDEGEMAVTWSIGDWLKKKWMTGDYVPTTIDPCAGEVPDDSDPNLLKYQQRRKWISMAQWYLPFATTFLVVIAWLFGENPQNKEECVGVNRRGLRCAVVVLVAFLSMTITFLSSLKAHCDDMIKEAIEAGVAEPSQEVRVLESTEIATMESSQQGTLDSLDPARIPHLRFALW